MRLHNFKQFIFLLYVLNILVITHK